MIHRIFSSLSSFKELEFHSGLNILVAQKEEGATDKQTRNRAGKTSLVEIIHLLTGTTIKKDSIFRSASLIDETFGLKFDLAGQVVTVEHSGKPRSKFETLGVSSENRALAKTKWKTMLGEKIFDLQKISAANGKRPNFRQLFPYFVRRENDGAFLTPEKHFAQQTTGDFQVALLYLLGLDWQIASEWQGVRDREKNLKELRKAAKDGAFGSIIGKASDLRTQLTVAEANLNKLREQLSSFHVLPQYSELESEADQLTADINEMANANVVDAALIRDLETAMRSEAPPPMTELESVYAEAGISLPSVVLKRYDEVRSFHESVIRNRRDYLGGELEAARQRVSARDQEKQRLDKRRAQVMNLLKGHGALEQFSNLQAEASRQEAEVEALRQRFDAAEQLEGTTSELEIERGRLALRLRRDFSEQSDRLSEAILAYEDTSGRLYESAGSMTVDSTTNGPRFDFPMQGARSKGIKNMRIFCFDMMLMRLCAKRGIGPGFLVHDSHLFDGVDGRQVASALKVGAEMAEEIGFQYIVTMNEDDVFKESTEGFDVREHILPVVLTDAKEDGGLFGIRF